MDSEIGKREEEIRLLKEELKLAKGDDIAYVQITREIISTYPSVKAVKLAQGASVTADSLHAHPCLTAIIKCDEPMNTEQQATLNNWLKVRLNTEEITLIVTQTE